MNLAAAIAALGGPAARYGRLIGQVTHLHGQFGRLPGGDGGRRREPVEARLEENQRRASAHDGEGEHAHEGRDPGMDRRRREPFSSGFRTRLWHILEGLDNEVERFASRCRADLQVRPSGRPEGLHDTGVKTL